MTWCTNHLIFIKQGKPFWFGQVGTLYWSPFAFSDSISKINSLQAPESKNRWAEEKITEIYTHSHALSASSMLPPRAGGKRGLRHTSRVNRCSVEWCVGGCYFAVLLLSTEAPDRGKLLSNCVSQVCAVPTAPASPSPLGYPGQPNDRQSGRVLLSLLESSDWWDWTM